MIRAVPQGAASLSLAVRESDRRKREVAIDSAVNWGEELAESESRWPPFGLSLGHETTGSERQRELAYSYRRATMGSTRVARRAGDQEAKSPSKAIASHTLTITRGSRG